MKLAISLFLTIWSIDSGNADSGKATYYGGNVGGNACGYTSLATSSFPYGYMAACGGTVFDDGYGCGKCYRITCIGPYSYNPGCSCDPDTPSVIISCMDQCPECTATHFDLNPLAMERIVGDGLAGTCGVIETTIERVSCDYTGNIKIRSKSGTSAYWYGLHIDDIAGTGAVDKVELKSSGSSSYDSTCTKNQGPSFWICDGGYPLTFPLSVRLTNDAGDQISCTNCITEYASEFDFGTNFASTPSTPTERVTPSPVRVTPAPVTSPTTTTTSSSSGSGIRVKQNNGVSSWWYAVEFPDGNINSVQKLEFRDSVHTSWIEGEKLSWGAITFPHGGTQFSGSQHFRVTTSAGRKASWNVFSGISPNSIATLSTKASPYTEDDTVGSSSLTIAGLIAIIIVSLLCILCIGCGVWYYKKHYQRLNKGQASFESTDADTPQSQPNATHDDDDGEDEAEIEVEMNVEYTNQGYENETTR